MKTLLLILVGLSIAYGRESFFSQRFPFLRRGHGFFRRPTAERVSTDRNLTITDKQNAKDKGPNVCPDRVFLGISYTCQVDNEKKNCSRKVYYRTAYICCPGFAQRRGQKGCPVELYTSSKNLTEVLSDLGLSTLLSLVKRAGLQGTLSSEGPFTLFAPTNEALAALPKEVTDALIKNPKKLAKVLLFHTVGGKIPSRSLKDEQLVKTLDAPNALRINILFSRRVITVQGARIIRANQGAKNGIVHVVNKVLSPATESSLEIIKKDGRLSRLYKAFVSSGIKLKRPYTIFAPTNDAFNSLKVMPKLESKECLQNLLKYHVVSRTTYSTMIGKHQKLSARTMEGSRLTIAERNDSVMIDDAKVLKTDITTTDGVVHIIDQVLITNSALTLVDVAKRAGASEVARLIQVAGLDKPLSGEKSFTLFAPTNDAIQKLPESIKKSLQNPDFLRNALLYHVVEGRVESGSLGNEQLVSTLLANKTVRVNVYNYGRVVTVQGASILPSKFDLKSCKGIVHVVNKVLLPPKGSVADLIEKDSRFSTLSSLLDKAGMKSTLRGMKAVTLFAPTNGAFSAIPQTAIEKLLEDDDKLKMLLKYHVFKGALYSAGLYDDCDLYALNGGRLNVRVTYSEIRINDVAVTEADLGATNGVVHVIDGVLQGKPTPMEKFLGFFDIF